LPPVSLLPVANCLWYSWCTFTCEYLREFSKTVEMTLKVPKRENFLLAFFALSEPIWVGDLGTKPQKIFFSHLTPDFDRFWFFAAYWVCGKSKKNLVRPKLKVDCCCIGAHMCTYNGFFWKFYSYGTLMNVYKF
jgi:hypothetical protein